MEKLNKKEIFIQKAKAKHGEKFDYTKLEYLGLNNEIIITCPIHGEVTQLAKSHLVRSGCIKCDEEKAKTKRKSGKYAKSKGR